jgi:hypothetical protein
MSWAGIAVCWRRPDQTDDEIYLEHYGDDDGNYPVPPPPTAQQLTCSARAVELIAATGLTIEREATSTVCYDEYTNVVIYDNSADVTPTRSTRLEGQHERLWEQVRLLAALADSFVIDGDDGFVYDLSTTESGEPLGYEWCDR